MTPLPDAIPLPSSPAQPLLVLGSTLGGPGLDAALALAADRPDDRITILEATWPAVDRTRAALIARGLDHRIWAHHASAARWSGRPPSAAA